MFLVSFFKYVSSNGLCLVSISQIDWLLGIAPYMPSDVDKCERVNWERGEQHWDEHYFLVCINCIIYAVRLSKSRNFQETFVPFL